MTDLSHTVESKSDQVSADDLISGPRTIEITKVSADPGSKEQPILIDFIGSNGKFFKPCKTVRRLLIHLYGPNGQDFVGKKLTLYRDPEVSFGGVKTGGVRVSHASHIDKTVTVALTATRGNKKPVTVHPLKDDPKQQATDPYAEYARTFARKLKEEPWQAVDSWWQNTAADREGMAQERVDKMSAALAAKIEKESA